MAIADLATYKTLLAAQRDLNAFNAGSNTTIAGRWHDLWRALVPLGNVPTTAAACDRTTVGALGQENAGAGEVLTVIGARANANGPGVYLLIDRLSHQGGLSGIVTGTVTTNLPTAALPRYADGAGVMIGLTIYTQIGTTATTITATYTNQDGTGSRATPLVAFGATGFREANRMILLPLQSGDTGVRSVESVTLTATTGTAGAYGVTLFKPLVPIVITDSSGVLSAGGFLSGSVLGGLPQILDGACLSMLCCPGTVNGQVSGALLFGVHPA